MASQTIKTPDQNERFKFFSYLSRDTTGKLGAVYSDFDDTLNYFISIKPEEFFAYYLQYKTYYEHQGSSSKILNDKKETVYWFPGNTEEESLKFIKEIYRNIKEDNEIYRNGKLVPDERPKTFRFALQLWLYIWH